MKRITRIVALVGCIACTIATAGTLPPEEKPINNPPTDTKTPTLSQTEMKDLQFIREEEKLAHDVYLIFYQEWERRVFLNISRSEQRHTDAIRNLLIKYGIDDPALPEIGEFSDEDLQDLFDDLAFKGLKSETAALYVGALIEEVDIKDLLKAIDQTDQADIIAVYSNLMAGSENHLAAFVRNIERTTGKTYSAQYLTQKEVDTILQR